MDFIENDTITRIVERQIEPIATYEEGVSGELDFTELTIGKYEEQYVLTRLSSHRAEYLEITDRGDVEGVSEMVRTLRFDPDTGAKRDVDVVNEEEWEHLTEHYTQKA